MVTTKGNTRQLLQPTREHLRVAIQGGAGAFHHIAAGYCFGQTELEVVPAVTFTELVRKLEAGQEADVGLMAIENSLEGSLMYNYRLLDQSELVIVGEVYLRIVQNLLALPGQRVDDLVEVHSHPMAIAQCRDFFQQYPHIRLVETDDTALSAKAIATDRFKGVGAIASSLAARLYGLDTLATGIETNKHNYTRFLVLEKKGSGMIRFDRPDKVSVCFSVDHSVGSLYRVLAVLAAYEINLTKIQSTPIVGKPWEYLFFVDFVADGKVSFEQALDAIRPLTRYLNILGTYPHGIQIDHA